MAKKRKKAAEALKEMEFIKEGAPKKRGRPKAEPMKAVTIRLPFPVYDKLWKVCALRRVDKIEPYAMQSVIRDAVNDWLKKHPIKR